MCRAGSFWLVIARENLQRMWWLLITSTFLSVLLAIYNIYIAGIRSLYSWSVFDLGGSAVFLGVFWLAKRGYVRDRLLWCLGPAYFAFWLTLMLGYYSTGLYAYGETSAFLIGAITPSVLILLPIRVASLLLLGYYAAFCVVLFGPWFAWREPNALAASFLNGSLGVVVAFLAAWFLYRFRYKNLVSEALIREQAEKARLDERTVRAILENMPFRAWLKNVDGRFLAVNHSFAASLGRTPEEIISKTSEELLDPAAAAVLREQDGHVIAHRDRFRIERTETDGDTQRWFEVFKCPVFAEDGSVAAIAGLSVDITEKKKLAESLIATDRAKSQFLAMMSHEIRTPMNSILGYSELLCGEIKEPEAVEQLRIIRDNGQLLLAIIDDILDLSKIEAGQLDLHPAPFETAELVERIRRRFASIAEQKGILLSTEIAAIPFAIADSRRLEQVLGNLVSNAVKFTSRGTVSLSVATQPAADDSYTLKCVVRDSGIGISKKDLERLFQPFTQVDSSIGRKYGGSGLGLVIARTLCMQMGGNLMVESTEGEGSTFTATVRVTRPNDIPLDHDETASDPPDSPASVCWSSRTTSATAASSQSSSANGASKSPSPRPARKPSIRSRLQSSTSCSWTCKCPAWTASKPRASSVGSKANTPSANAAASSPSPHSPWSATSKNASTPEWTAMSASRSIFRS